MGIKQTLDVINEMEREGVIGRYAIGGAVAAYNYIEAASTENLGIFVSIASKSSLISLDPILAYLRHRGYREFLKEGIMIEGWAVQFLPISNALDQEALDRAELIDIRANAGKVRARVMNPEHLVALALRVGRAKDFQRVRQFLDEKAVNLRKLRAVIERHDLRQAWRTFCGKAGVRDSFASR